MAPKKNKDTLNEHAAGLTEEQQAALETSQLLQAAAKTQGVGVPRCRSLASTGWISNHWTAAQSGGVVRMQVLTGARRVTSQELPTPKRELSTGTAHKNSFLTDRLTYAYSVLPSNCVPPFTCSLAQG